MKKRVFAMFTALSMTVTMLPTPALATTIPTEPSRSAELMLTATNNSIASPIEIQVTNLEVGEIPEVTIISEGPYTLDSVKWRIESLGPDGNEIDDSDCYDSLAFRHQGEQYVTVTLRANTGYEFSEGYYNANDDSLIFNGENPSSYSFGSETMEIKGTVVVSAPAAERTLSFRFPSVSEFYSEDLTITNVLIDSAADEENTTAVVYSSSDDSIVTVDANTGEITIHKAGTVTITASAAKNDAFKAAFASYELTINKAAQTAPAALTASELTVTANSIKVTEPKAGYEYACAIPGSQSEWRANGSFTGLSPNTEYQVFARLAATDSLNASAASEPCTVTTPKGTQVAPAALTANDLTVTADSITVKTVTGYEYALSPDSSDWSTSGIFTNLLPNTQYQVFARLAETDRYNASAASEPCTVTTPKGTQAAPDALTEEDLTITANSIEIKALMAGYEYTCIASGETPVWSTNGIFTGLLPNTEYQVFARLAETDSCNASAASEPCTITTPKGAIPTPTALTANNLTVTSNTIKVNAPKVGYEYACITSDATLVWSTNGNFTGLLPNTEYQVYVRVAATDSYNASEAAAPCTVTTLKAAQAAPDALSAADLTVTADSITVNAAAGYEYAISSNLNNWSTSGIFTGLLPNTEYQIYVRLAETNSAYASEASDPCTVTTLKATQTAPDALSVADLTVTADSITVNVAT
ncbi:MAG: Ig-like domain-containing protein, partial [Clostridia bacterium]|nr:Ig-like domain-containing protein [Clostridia bacterium]